MLSLLDALTLFGYAAMLIAIALYHARKIRVRDDYYLAGRTMSRWPIALYPRMSYRLRITTAYEYLEKRFNYPVRALAALFFMGARIMWMATMLYAGSLVVSQMLGWTAERGVPGGQVYAIVLLGTLGLFMDLAGGMHAVIWTDVAQFFVLFGSVAVMVTLAFLKSGGPAHVLATAVAAHKLAPPVFFSLSETLSIVSGLCLGFVSMLSSGRAVAGFAATIALNALGRVSDFYYGIFGAATTFLCGYLLSRLFRPPAAASLEGLTHRARPAAAAVDNV
ncbi:MAG: hypothetical protein AAB225_07875 [Acidobacteriota bacterium]